MTKTHVGKLLRVLDKERSMLVSGDLKGAAALSESKERLIDRTFAEILQPDQAAALRAAAERNRHLVEAARFGFEAAHEKLRALRNGVGVNTYSAQGQRQMIERTSGTLQKRA